MLSLLVLSPLPPSKRIFIHSIWALSSPTHQLLPGSQWPQQTQKCLWFHRCRSHCLPHANHWSSGLWYAWSIDCQQAGAFHPLPIGWQDSGTQRQCMAIPLVAPPLLPGPGSYLEWLGWILLGLRTEKQTEFRGQSKQTESRPSPNSMNGSAWQWKVLSNPFKDLSLPSNWLHGRIFQVFSLACGHLDTYSGTALDEGDINRGDSAPVISKKCAGQLSQVAQNSKKQDAEPSLHHVSRMPHHFFSFP